MAARHASIPLADAVIEAIVEQYADPASHDPKVLLLITTHLPIRQAFLDATAGIQAPLTAVIAKRIAEPDEPIARVLSASVTAAVGIALGRWGGKPACLLLPARSLCHPARCQNPPGLPRAHRTGA